jgi:hypothetical protein
MRHVIPGSKARNSRRKSAIVRLEKHLGDHKSNHKDVEDITIHDKAQRKELEHMKEITKD